MKNIGQMMKQAQQVQSKMAEMQEHLANLEVEGVAGGGMVKVTLTGKGIAKAVAIDRALVSGPDDAEVLEDLIVAAINDAKGKSEALVKEKMAELTGGMSLPPGFNLPF